ncbi:type III secretion system export apparatus subunit SctS [Thalassomonas viridans]|uniref:Type III secretion system export apparatus subunit SctS n=1 Tax=Thalassomonas viridans TaxID=137584 RepID=A0AAF0CDJ4_9GAMM|nr:type III secretion system export apparatus subunit SctS [Thalassomonas viridans]WDE08640.1 type III secretion system export apparatus subunit SctS [Thalassomonas viridans]
MNNADIIHHTMQVLGLVLLLSLPPILMAAGVGILISLFQALTQIQEQTLSFCFKLIAVSFTLVVTARWMGIELYNYTLMMMQSIGSL